MLETSNAATGASRLYLASVRCVVNRSTTWQDDRRLGNTSDVSHLIGIVISDFLSISEVI